MRKAVLALLAVLAVVSAAAAAPAEDAKQDLKYTKESVARVSFTGGKTFIQRSSDLGYEEAIVNTPIAEGDRLNTSDGRAEIQFGDRNFLRLDENTKVDILNLPKKGDDLVRMRLWSGSAYLEINNLAKEKSIEVHTADTSFYVLDRGIFRVDVRDGRTGLEVFRGLVEAAGESGSTLVKGDQRVEVAEGRFTSKPEALGETGDGFDDWNGERSREYGRPIASRHLPKDLEEYESELDANGDWTYLEPYGDVWVPRGMAADWRPYNSGRWVWLGVSGWTWLPYEPWGWAPFHYGRWHWGVGLGWYWIPMNIWGPGWVDWWWNDSYFGWSPISYWGYPVVIVDGIFYGRDTWNHYPWNSRSLTVIRRDQLKARNIADVALRDENALRSVGAMRLSSPTLTLRPGGGSVVAQPLDGKRVILRDSGKVGSLSSGGERGSISGAGSSGRSIRSLGGSSKGAAAGSGKSSGSVSSGKSSSSGKSGSSSSGRSVRSNSGSSSKGSSSSGGRSIRKKDEPEASASLASPAGSVSGSPGAWASRSLTSRSIAGYPASPRIGGRSESSYPSRSGSALSRLFRSPSSASRYSYPARSSSSWSRPSSSWSGPSWSSGRSSSWSGGFSHGGSTGGSHSSGGSIRRK